MTPEIPEHIKALRHPGYKNIFEIEPENRNLYGTESLMGDWSGKGLILAQDFGTASYVSKNGYKHNETYPTNKNLISILQRCGYDVLTRGNRHCDFLYGSACFLLKNTLGTSDPLPDRRAALTKSHPVLDFVLANMVNLKFIICLGKHSTDSVARFFSMPIQWRGSVENNQSHLVLHKGRHFFVYPTNHTGGLGMAQIKLDPNDKCTRIEKVAEQWRQFFQFIEGR